MQKLCNFFCLYISKPEKNAVTIQLLIRKNEVGLKQAVKVLNMQLFLYKVANSIKL